MARCYIILLINPMNLLNYHGKKFVKLSKKLVSKLKMNEILKMLPIHKIKKVFYSINIKQFSLLQQNQSDLTVSKKSLSRKMVLSWPIIFGIVTGFWGLVGLVGPFLVKKDNPSASIYRVCIVMTAICCWLHWVLCFLSQVNPLAGPTLSKDGVKIIQWSWENKDEIWRYKNLTQHHLVPS